MTLAGGGALLHGMADRMREECQMPAWLAEPAQLRRDDPDKPSRSSRRSNGR